jgi:hypothetical protein
MSQSIVGGAAALCIAQAQPAAGDVAAAARWRARAVRACAAYVTRRPDDAWGRTMRMHARLAAGSLEGALEDVTAALTGRLPQEQAERLQAIKADLQRRLAEGEGR